MPEPPRHLRITDPKDLRALAHPARQRVISELYSGEVLTASEAARLCGLSPSAMSYHLRALHRSGLVEPGESQDGRERPWRAAAENFEIAHEAYAAAGLDLSRQHLRAWSADLVEGLDRLVQQLAQGQHRGLASAGNLWLTDAEETELGKDILALWQRYAGRTQADHPQDARRREVYLLSLPKPEGE